MTFRDSSISNLRRQRLQALAVILASLFEFQGIQTQVLMLGQQACLNHYSGPDSDSKWPSLTQHVSGISSFILNICQIIGFTISIETKWLSLNERSFISVCTRQLQRWLVLKLHRSSAHPALRNSQLMTITMIRVLAWERHLQMLCVGSFLYI